MTRSAGDAPRLTEIFPAATGSRQARTVLVPVRLPDVPPWAAAPLPFLTNGGPAELRARAQLFTLSATRAPYGHRRHRAPALSPSQWIAVPCVVAAFLGSTRGTRPSHG